MATPPRIDRVNILLVDDQPAKLLTYQAILDELGENLITASSATDALQQLLRTEVAVVLVDVCMPELDGYELAAMIRQHPRFQRTAIIFVSAILLTDLDRLRGYECGAVDYVPVPVVPEILRAKVGVFADLYRKTRALERLNVELEARVAERTAALAATTQELQEAAARKDEFIAMLAHELRNPLAPIRTAAQLLRLKELGEAQRARARDMIERQVEHLVALIDDLLDVTRITRGMIGLHREPVLVGAIVARALETVRPAIDAKRHELVLDLPDALITVDGDKTRLVQVVANIVHNAAKFTEPGGQITLRVSRDGPSAVIAVRDTGVGIAAEHLPEIFELFTQARGQAEQGGLGIGLALVRRLTEMHGGTVAAYSEGPGCGTEVRVRLPIASSAAPAAGESTPEPDAAVAPTARRRVLVADDNHDAALALTLQLQHLGHDARAVHDGAAALAEAEAFAPEILLLDLGMPKLNGYDVARALRCQPWAAHMTLVAITGWGQPEDRRRSREAGFDRHLVKPVGEADLRDVLAAAAGRAPDVRPDVAANGDA